MLLLTPAATICPLLPFNTIAYLSAVQIAYKTYSPEPVAPASINALTVTLVPAVYLTEPVAVSAQPAKVYPVLSYTSLSVIVLVSYGALLIVALAPSFNVAVP